MNKNKNSQPCRILGVILARGGSKGIPKKNIKSLSGHPLIAYTIYAGLQSRLITDLIVSTDDKEIASISREYGALVPFFRPAALAQDDIFSRDALRHAVLEAEKYFGKTYDFIIELPCVAPLRDADDIDKALGKLIESGADSVISVCRMSDKHPVRMKRITKDQILDFCSEYPEDECSRRQDLEPCYIRNGAIYAMRRSTIVDNQSRLGKISRPYIMPEEKSVNIDSMVDFYLAEAMISRGLCNNYPNAINAEACLETFVYSGRPKLLFSAGYEFMPDFKKYIREHFDVIFAHKAPREQVKQLLKDRVAWVCSPCPGYIINKDIIDSAPALGIIATPSTGTNHIDLEYARKKNIAVFSLRGSEIIEDIHASAEFSFTLLLSLIKRVFYSLQQARIGIWREREEEFRNIELYGKTLGIVGLGRIGRKMARFAQAFSMNVLTYDPYQKVDNPGLRQTEFSELLQSCDIISVHVPLTEETKGMFNQSVFDSMKDGIYFINTSRGEVLDEQALLHALDSGKIKAAAVDVICNEHVANKRNLPLIKYARGHGNLIVTPHIAGLTVESEYKAAKYITHKIIEHLGCPRGGE